MNTQLMFEPLKKGADVYFADIIGRIRLADGVTATAKLAVDETTHIDDDDVHNVEVNPDCAEDIERVRKAWFADEWNYCGVIVTVTCAGAELAESSLWGIEINYPHKDGTIDNSYLIDVANELLPETIERAVAQAELIRNAVAGLATQHA